MNKNQAHANVCFRVGILCLTQSRIVLEAALHMTWSLNKHFWLTDQSEALICLRTVRCVSVCVCKYCEIITLYKSAPTTSHSCCPWIHFHFAEQVDRPSPSGALVLFLGRPLNDRCLAVSQMQPWRSPHWAWLNRCPFLITPLSVSICQPCIVSQHSTVQLTSMIVKLAYTNLVSFSAVFPFRGEGWIWNNKVRCPVTRGWIK